uniref:Uncharacterized protein n=2 Tax=Emiliania huxleyi TaxID=2903 RepID=A0A0D3HXG4_EMIH1
AIGTLRPSGQLAFGSVGHRDIASIGTARLRVSWPSGHCVHRDSSPSGQLAIGTLRPSGQLAFGSVGHRDIASIGTARLRVSWPSGHCVHRDSSPSGQLAIGTLRPSGHCVHRDIASIGPARLRASWPSGQLAFGSAGHRASSPFLVPAPGEWAWQYPLPSVGRARLPPLATCCRPGRGAVRCRGGGSASGI